MSLARNATASQSPTQTNGYERHQPDQTLLYQLAAAFVVLVPAAWALGLWQLRPTPLADCGLGSVTAP